MMRFISGVAMCLVVMVACFSCNQGPKDADVSDVHINFQFNRFEKDLFASDSLGVKRLHDLKLKYGQFTDVFVHNILSIHPASEAEEAFNLQKFVNDAEVRDIKRLTDSVFQETASIESGMNDFLKHYHFYFPQKPVPSVVTYISAFNYAVITTDSAIGIGLDMFLGPNISYYARLGIPLYIFNKFSKEYIVPSAIKACFQSDNDQAVVKSEFLSQMIYQGKLLYYMNVMAPEMQDTLKTGYTASQLQWCRENEGSIWAFFIENKLLFNTDPSQYSKFVSEGPTTNGFPKEAPGKIAAWVGWQIVNEYMDKKGSATLTDLLNEKDAQKILETSGYKPKK